MAAMLLGLTVFSYFISSVSQAVEMMNAASMRSKEQRRVCPTAPVHPYPRADTVAPDICSVILHSTAAYLEIAAGEGMKLASPQDAVPQAIRPQHICIAQCQRRTTASASHQTGATMPGPHVASCELVLRVNATSWPVSCQATADASARVRAALTRAHVQTIDMFAQMHKLPRSMHHRVRTYYDYLLRNGVHDLNSHVVTSLSPQLRQDVLLFLYSDLVAKVPFFRNKSTHFIAELIQKLDAEVFPPGEYVTIEVRLRPVPG